MERRNGKGYVWAVSAALNAALAAVSAKFFVSQVFFSFSCRSSDVIDLLIVFGRFSV